MSTDNDTIVRMETWRPVVGWVGSYEVSDLGRVRSLDRIIVKKNGHRCRLRGQLVKPTKSGRYLGVSLDGRHRSVHRLVLNAFIGPRPSTVDTRHRDDNPHNNVLSNLEWGTRSENVQDCLSRGRNSARNRIRCPQNHLLAGPNLVPSETLRGYRKCRACANAKCHIFYRDKKGYTHGTLQEVSDWYYQKLMPLIM